MLAWLGRVGYGYGVSAFLSSSLGWMGVDMILALGWMGVGMMGRGRIGMMRRMGMM
jgi:NADH/NAD ratio-sensing transcriptional regulator Rex